MDRDGDVDIRISRTTGVIMDVSLAVTVAYLVGAILVIFARVRRVAGNFLIHVHFGSVVKPGTEPVHRELHQTRLLERRQHEPQKKAKTETETELTRSSPRSRPPEVNKGTWQI